MKLRKPLWFAGSLLSAAVCFGLSGCHYDRNTAGRLDAERGDGELGSTTYTKEGTGDPRVGSGRGQVGTDAPPKANTSEQPTSTGEHGDATGGRPDLQQAK